jgi:hypothetical protein
MSGSQSQLTPDQQTEQNILASPDCAPIDRLTGTQDGIRFYLLAEGSQSASIGSRAIYPYIYYPVDGEGNLGCSGQGALVIEDFNAARNTNLEMSS